MLHDDYLSCGQYQNQPKHATAKDFSSFVDVKTGKHYFALVDQAGNVLLRSEGYETEKARENGVKSVTTNFSIVKQYAVVAEGGQFLVSLKAANHREIALSCPFAKEAEAKAFITRMGSAHPFAVSKTSIAKVAAPKVATPKVTAAKVVAPKVEKVAAPKVTAAKVVAPKVEKVATPKATVAKVVAPKVEKVAAPKVASVKSVPSQTKIAAYQAQGFYLGHETLRFGQIQTGYTKFVGQDGAYYFAVYNPDGSLYLGSAAFQLEEMRDANFVAVVQNIENPSNYNVIEAANAFFMVLVGENGKELARSGAFGSFTEAFKNTPNGRVRSEVSLY